MGFLSETKVKRKINHDPNNTKWTRNENTFGQKILRSHGWQPGQYLGAQDAPHAELHGTANASYIRVTLKDDMKGLGFDKAMKDDEITGLDVFTDLLSRLNGKSEESVEKDRAKRLEFKTHRFVEQRYGAMRFVRGGLLVGDELKEDHNDAKPEENKTPEAVEANPAEVDPESSKEKDKKKSSKKRKAASLNEEDEEDDKNTPTAVSASDLEPKKKRKKDEKRSKKRSTDVSSEDSSSEAETKSKKKEKKEKKEKKSKKDKSAKDIPAASEEEDEEMIETPDQPDDSQPTSKSKKSKEERKEEKRLKKLLKEERKAEKKRKRAEAKAESESSSPEPTSSADVTTASVTPAASGTSTPRNNPHFVRAKFLKAKREAMMDSNAINKIFMMKA